MRTIASLLSLETATILRGEDKCLKKNCVKKLIQSLGKIKGEI